jgi:hypothetical protein
MCDIILIDEVEEDIDTPRKLVPYCKKLALYEGSFSLVLDNCLCQINIEETAKINGYTCTLDGMLYEWKKTIPKIEKKVGE